MRKKHYLVLLAVILMAGCGSQSTPTVSTEAETQVSEAPIIEETESKEPEFDKDAYKSLVKDAVTMIDEDCVALSNLISYEYDKLDANAKVGLTSQTSEDLAASAISWLEENSDYKVDDLNDHFQELTLSYGDLAFIQTDDPELKKIAESYDSLYLSYAVVHDLATNPPTDMDDLYIRYNAQYEDIKESDIVLHPLLGIED